MTTLEFKLPDIGEGVHEGEIVRWIAAEGVSVSEDDPVVEVMTDKATVEIPSPMTGVVAKQLVAEGDVAKVGDVIFVIEGEGDAGSSKRPVSVTSESKVATKQETSPASVQSENLPSSRQPSGGKVLAAPATRRLAREMGVNLSSVSGTGKNGRIRPTDIRESSTPSAPPSKPVPTLAASGSREVIQIPFRGIRRKTAEAMSQSKFTATHFSLVEEVDCTAIAEARSKAKEVGERHGVKVTWMPYIMKATALALMEFPQLNAELDEAAGVILQKKYVNLGIAVDTPNGLMVPVVQDCHLKACCSFPQSLLMSPRVRVKEKPPQAILRIRHSQSVTLETLEEFWQPPLSISQKLPLWVSIPCGKCLAVSGMTLLRAW